MKKLALIPLAIFIIVAGSSFTTRSTPAVVAEESCFIAVDMEWGGHCNNSPNSFQVKFKNTCHEKMDLRFALKQTDGSWYVGNDYGIEYGQKGGASAYSCKATGRYLCWSKKSGDNTVRFPTNEEIQKIE